MAADICRLCLRTIDKAKSIDLVAETTKFAMLKQFLPEMNLDITENTQVCSNCIQELEVSYNFKQSVVVNEANIQTKLEENKLKKIDLKSMLDDVAKKELKEDDYVCRTCLLICRTPSISLFDTPSNMMPCSFVKKMCQLVFELEFIASDKPVLCDECWETLQTVYNFRKCCLKTDKKLRTYVAKKNLKKLGVEEFKKFVEENPPIDNDEVSSDDELDGYIKEEPIDEEELKFDPEEASCSSASLKFKEETTVKSESDEDMEDEPELLDPKALKSETSELDGEDCKLEIGDVKVDAEGEGAAGPSGFLGSKEGTSYDATISHQMDSILPSHMGVAQILILKSRNQLTREKQLHLIQNGRPQTFFPSENDQIEKSVYELNEWICGCPENRAFFCYPCLLFSTEDSFWAKHGVKDFKHLRENAESHSNSASHLESILSMATLELDINSKLSSKQMIVKFNNEVAKNRYVISKLIENVKFCGALESVLPEVGQKCSQLVDLDTEIEHIFKKNTEKYQILQEVSDTLRRDLLESMDAIYYKEVATEIDQADFVAVQVKDVTHKNSGDIPQMAFIIRYFSQNEIHERFWSFFNAETALQIANIIFEVLKVLKLNTKPEKVIAVSYDLPSELRAKFNDVHNKIKEVYTSAHLVHSHANPFNCRFDLILEKVATEYKPLKIFFVKLHDLGSFFKNRPKYLMHVYKNIQSKTNTNVIPLCFGEKLIQTIFSYRVQFVTCLQGIMSDKTEIINKCMKLLSYFDDDFLYWLRFFNEIMSYLDDASNRLETCFKDDTNSKKIIADFCKNIYQYRKTFRSHEYIAADSSGVKRMKIKDIRRYIAWELCHDIVIDLEHRFSFVGHFHIAHIFDSTRFKVYRYQNNFPHDAIDAIHKCYPSISLNCIKLESELKTIYFHEDFCVSDSTLAMLQFFINMGLSETFSETVKLLKLLCTLPVETVTNEAELYPLTIERIKTFLSNTEAHSNSTSLAILSLERVCINKIKNFNELVIDHFVTNKDKKISLKYKQF